VETLYLLLTFLYNICGAKEPLRNNLLYFFVRILAVPLIENEFFIWKGANDVHRSKYNRAEARKMLDGRPSFQER
jgi:hypothetical protein